MLIAAAVLLGLLALAVGLLTVPVDVEVTRPGGGRPTSVRVSWLAGRLSWDPTAGGEPSRREQAPAGEEEERADSGSGEAPEREARAGRRGPGPRRALAALGTPGLGPAAGRLLSRLSRAILLRRAAARIRLSDPADTGRVWGAVGSGSALLPPAWRSRLDVRPDFSPGEPRVTGRLRARVTPLRLMTAVLAFVLSPAAVRAGWRVARAGR